MESRFRQTLLHRLVLIENMPEILHRRRNNPTTARRADDEVKRAVDAVLDDCRGDGGQGAFSGFDEIGGRGSVAEGV